MPGQVNNGDQLVIPGLTERTKADGNKITIHWSQSLRKRDADYYVVVATNKSHENAKVPLYIQLDWYNEYQLGVTTGIKKIDNGDYEITVDSRFQYGSVGAIGFVVWHDKSKTPFSKRFLDTRFLERGTVTAANIAAIFNPQLGKSLQAGSAISSAIEVFGGAIDGEYLKDF